ncbi:MAG TPA: hypothetical protein VER08_02105 [Pyrinomonadaceae bacterium]|nr:hypothetical protein [Pyrinomonadaceae bacterium]
MNYLLLMVVLFLPPTVFDQTPNAQTRPASAAAASASGDVTPTYVVGDVKEIDAARAWLKLSTGAGEFTVQLAAATRYVRLTPGETNIEKGEAITAADVNVGDRVMARGRVAAEQKSVPARVLIVMKKEELARKTERERAEWRRRGISGRITAVNAQAKEVTLSVRSREGESAVVLSIPDGVTQRRYTPRTVKFSDAQPSTFAELKVGDVVHALGERSADGTRYTPVEVVSGAFRMVGGRVTEVDAAKGEVTIRDLQTNRLVRVTVTPDSLLRRIQPENAPALLGRRPGAGGAGGAGGGGGGQNAGGQPARAAAGRDVQEVVEQLPAIPVTDLKAGDMVLVSSTAGPDPTRATAIILAAGAEVVFRAAQRPAQQAGRTPPSPSLGLPTGLFDGVVVP